MLREKRDDNILTNRKNSNWSRISKKNIEKQNLMLPVLSITQLKLGQKFGANKTLARPLPTSKIIHDARLRSSLSKRSETNFHLSRAKTPSQNDSFSTDQNQKTEQSTMQKIYKKKLLPPLNANTDKYSMSNMTTPPKSLKSQQVQVQMQAKSTKQKQKRLRLKTDCKIILQKNNLFPFYNRNGSKSKTVDRRQDRKQVRKENVENNAQVQDEEIFKFQQSAISQIGIKQDPAQFISKDSFKEILDA